MLTSDFSLQQWLSDEDLQSADFPLDEYYSSKLLNITNLSPFLIEDACLLNTADTDPWKIGSNAILSSCSLKFLSRSFVNNVMLIL